MKGESLARSVPLKGQRIPRPLQSAIHMSTIHFLDDLASTQDERCLGHDRFLSNEIIAGVILGNLKIIKSPSPVLNELEESLLAV